MQLYSKQPFHLKSFIQEKLRVNFFIFVIQILQMTLDWELTKIKIVDLEKL